MCSYPHKLGGAVARFAAEVMVYDEVDEGLTLDGAIGLHFIRPSDVHNDEILITDAFLDLVEVDT